MITFEDIIKYLAEYDGEPLTIMEVCGTHTSEIAKNGIRSMLSPKIKLVSGPGCPVCVTVTEYVDKLCELAKRDGNVVVTFGDMIKVAGSSGSLYDTMAEGGRVKMVYSPFEIIDLANEDKSKTFIFAAVGFETTTPIYAMLIDAAVKNGIENIKLLTSLKTMPPAIEWVCVQNHNISGFISPGHVAAITGSNLFKPISLKYKLPFVVAGFSGEQILAAIYTLIKYKNKPAVINLYKNAVTEQANTGADEIVAKYFEPDAASWRGLGKIDGSGMYLRSEYRFYDAGSRGLENDISRSNICRCADIITGRANPTECPLFAKACTPNTPKGACMVSGEGCCNIAYGER